jgi:hypothetical protein
MLYRFQTVQVDALALVSLSPELYRELVVGAWTGLIADSNAMIMERLRAELGMPNRWGKVWFGTFKPLEA